MSHHFLPARPDRRALGRAVNVACGWDPNASSYFMRVVVQQPRPGEEACVAQAGLDAPVTELDALLDRLAGWAHIPAGLPAALEDDRARLAGRP